MRVIAGILLGVLLVVAAVGAVLWTGSYNVAATNSAGKLETRLAVFAVNRSIQKRAPVKMNPFSKPEDIRAGLAHFKENCLDCHGAPGVEESEFGQGLNPPAPDLTLPAVQRMRDGEIFWVISNGIRMTGMPAFSPTHKEEEIWKIVALVHHLPEITNEEQQILRAGREEEGHHEASESPAAPGVKTEAKEEQKPAAGEKQGHAHPPGAKPHKD